MRMALIVLLAVLLIGGFIFGILVAVNTDERISPAFVVTLPMLPKIFGIIIATSAALGLFIMAFRGEPIPRLIAMLLPLLGGVLLITPHWGVAIALAVIAVAFVLEEILRMFLASRRPPDAV